MPEQLKALSVRQPYAEQILRGLKTIEYRSIFTKIRGRIYIYASQKLDDDDYEFGEELDVPIGDLPRGVVVGTVEITECVQDGDDYEWHLANPQRLSEPLPPQEHPQPVWFHPFGRPDDEPSLVLAEANPSAGDAEDSDEPSSRLSNTRFAPVLDSAQRPFTPYHSKYFAYELTKQVGADQGDKLSQSLSNATVAMNPHQVDAALFAFRSPLSRGAILADEVGLGKTIEAGIIVSQLWAEKKRRILVLVPAALRKQWSGELIEKFFLPSMIMESKSFRELSRKSPSPFQPANQIVICSHQFARTKAQEIAAVPWDLVVIDEAHRMRNVYKRDNKIARTIRAAIRTRPKILLTATPLQNSLMELYGLVSFVDEHVFGSEEAFRERYAKKSENLTPGALANLRARLAGICQRTLRKQVTEYISYTRRIPMTEDFTPSAQEQELYDRVSAYLQKDNLLALPNSQRQLIELVLRKILASSSFAIAATLGTMIERLKKLEKAALPPEQHVADIVGDDYEQADAIEEEWTDETPDESPEESAASPTGSPASSAKASDPSLLQNLRLESAELQSFKNLAESIPENAKGDSLLRALRLGFLKAQELGAKPKALIFTESRRTQVYLSKLLADNGYAGQIVLFNGTNTDPDSKRVYQEWVKRHRGQDCVSGSPTSDMRAALVEEFAERASIMIATESAAEGVNLQFCSLVVNYDLPWNPQRIEQRIGRCHRYGQKHDVVVINFVNRANEADQRVYKLLNEKFKLFDGVFGASDEVLGALESGIDFEKRINDIYKRCRTSDQIQQAFDQLQVDLNDQIQTTYQSAQSKLLENFDEEVHQKLQMHNAETGQRLDRYGDWLWTLTATELAEAADFSLGDYRFSLKVRPSIDVDAQIPLGTYRLLRPHAPADAAKYPDDHIYRPGHPLAEAVVAQAQDRALSPRELVLDYASRGARVSLVERLRGQSGWLRVEKLAITSLETEEMLLLAGVTDDGKVLARDTCEKLLTIPARAGDIVPVDEAVRTRLETALQAQLNRLIHDSQNRNEKFFVAESDKLDSWADDLNENLEREIKNLEVEIRDAKKAKRLAPDLEGKIAATKRVNELEQHRNTKKRSLYDAQDDNQQRKDALVQEIEGRLQQKTSRNEVFTVRWRLG